jgi:hypothetical protein
MIDNRMMRHAIMGHEEGDDPRPSRFVVDNHTRRLIPYRDTYTESQVCTKFGITKGQLRKAVKSGGFPKPTKYGPGNKPWWADTIIDKVSRVDEDE